jgi:hypothetical protein
MEELDEGPLRQSEVVEIREVILWHKQSEGMRDAFRKAASDLAIEAGVISAPVKDGDDVYALQLLAESQLSMQRLSVRYEKLRAAATPVTDAVGRLSTFGGDPVAAKTELNAILRGLKEVLDDG